MFFFRNQDLNYTVINAKTSHSLLNMFVHEFVKCRSQYLSWILLDKAGECISDICFPFLIYKRYVELKR